MVDVAVGLGGWMCVGVRVPVAVDVAEVELSAGREHAVRLVDDALLVRAQVDDAVADDNVERLVLQPRLVQKLNVALDERHVGLGISAHNIAPKEAAGSADATCTTAHAPLLQ